MMLDCGVCAVFRRQETAQPGAMPRAGYALLVRGWYGELSFETAPVRPTPGREENKTAARIRILQCRAIRKGDVVVLSDIDDFSAREACAQVYRITRAYHGKDDKSGALISDLSLEVITP